MPRSPRRRPHLCLMTGLALVAVLAFGCLPLGTAGAAPAAPAVDAPTRMDASNQAGWWHPMDEHGGRVYIAYNGWGSSRHGGANDTHRVYVAHQDGSGRWRRGCLPGPGGCVVYRDDIGHNQPTLVVDGDGHIHVFASMHGHNWRYFRSARPGDPTSMVDRSGEMPDQGGNYTYPTATRTPNGDVYVAVRSGRQGNLYRWDDAADRWSRAATFAASPQHTVYPDDIVSDAAGNVHIVWEWAYGGANGLRHLGSYLRYEPATGGFSSAAGHAVAAPAGPAGAAVYQPIEPGERATDRGSPANPPGLQSAKLALDPATGRPVVAYRFRPAAGGRFEVRLAEWQGPRAGWRRQTVYAGRYNTYAAVDLTVRGGVPRVYYAKSGVPNRNQVTMATRGPGGRWVETFLAPGVPVERLSVVDTGGSDHVYMSAPTAHRLSIEQHR